MYALHEGHLHLQFFKPPPGVPSHHLFQRVCVCTGKTFFLYGHWGVNESIVT